MTDLRPLIWAMCAIYLSAVAQGRLSHTLHLRWAQPDFPLLVLACAGVLLGGNRSPLLGLWTGLLAAVMLPSLYGTIITSRVCAGALAGYLNRFVIRDSWVVPPLVVLFVTLFAEIITVLFDPSLALHSPRVWLYKVGGEVLYNTLLALPVYFFLRRLGLGMDQKDPFAARP